MEKLNKEIEKRRRELLDLIRLRESELKTAREAESVRIRAILVKTINEVAVPETPYSEKDIEDEYPELLSELQSIIEDC